MTGNDRVDRTDRTDRREGRVFVGPPSPRRTAPDDVLPAVVTTLSDDTRRYVCYSDRAGTRDVGVASTRLSVDPDAVVSLELWR